MPASRSLALSLAALLAISTFAGARAQDSLLASWDDLGSKDGAKAYRAIWALTRTPEKSVAFLKARLQPVSVDAQRVERLISDLGSDSFPVRAKAVKELKSQGERALPQLAEALERKKLPLEVKRRVETLLHQIKDELSPEQLQQLRAVEALEQIGSAEALQLLRQLSGGMPHAKLTQDALASAERLARKPATAPVKPAGPAPTHDLHGDPLPKGALLRLGTTRLRGAARAIFTPDGKTLVGIGSRQVFAWEVATARAVGGFPKPIEHWSDSLAFSPDGKLLATTPAGNLYIELWEWPAMKRRAVLAPVLKATATTLIAVTNIGFSADGKTLWAADGHTALWWDTSTGEELRRFRHDAPLEKGEQNNVVVFSPDGKFLVTGNRYRNQTTDEHTETIRLWDCAAEKVIAVLDGHKSGLQAVAFAEYRPWMASADGKGVVRLWDVKTGRLRQQCKTGGERVQALAFSAGGRSMAVVDWEDDSNSRVVLFDLTEARQLPRSIPIRRQLWWAEFAPRGDMLALSCFDDAVRLLDCRTGKELHDLEGHETGIYAVAYSPDGKSIATGGLDYTVRLWNAATGKPIWKFHTDHRCLSVKFSANGQMLTTNGNILDLKSKQKVKLLPEDSGMHEVKVSPNGKFAAWFSRSSVQLRTSPDGKLISTHEHESQEVQSAAFSSDGNRLVIEFGTYYFERTVRVLDLKTGATLFQHSGKVFNFTLSPDGRTLAVTDLQEVRLIEILTGAERRRFTSFNPMAFSPDGRRFAHVHVSVTKEKRLRSVVYLQRLDKDANADPAIDYPGYIRAIAFSPDGRRLATSGNEATALVWDIEDK